MTSYKIAACCQREWWEIEQGCISSHRNYGERMCLLFNKEIQSQYYQNTSVSVEGASMELLDDGGGSTYDILDIGQMIQSRMLMPPLAI